MHTGGLSAAPRDSVLVQTTFAPSPASKYRSTSHCSPRRHRLQAPREIAGIERPGSQTLQEGRNMPFRRIPKGFLCATPSALDACNQSPLSSVLSTRLHESQAPSHPRPAPREHLPSRAVPFLRGCRLGGRSCPSLSDLCIGCLGGCLAGTSNCCCGRCAAP